MQLLSGQTGSLLTSYWLHASRRGSLRWTKEKTRAPAGCNGFGISHRKATNLKPMTVSIGFLFFFLFHSLSAPPIAQSPSTGPRPVCALCHLQVTVYRFLTPAIDFVTRTGGSVYLRPRAPQSAAFGKALSSHTPCPFLLRALVMPLAWYRERRP